MVSFLDSLLLFNISRGQRGVCNGHPAFGAQYFTSLPRAVSEANILFLFGLRSLWGKALFYCVHSHFEQ